MCNSYDSDVRRLCMPSLTLAPSGDDKSTMRHHLPSFGFPFGITPNRLVWMNGHSSGFNGPSTLPLLHSSARYSSTTSGCSMADAIFIVESRHPRRLWEMPSPLPDAVADPGVPLDGGRVSPSLPPLGRLLGGPGA